VAALLGVLRTSAAVPATCARAVGLHRARRHMSTRLLRIAETVLFCCRCILVRCYALSLCASSSPAYYELAFSRPAAFMNSCRGTYFLLDSWWLYVPATTACSWRSVLLLMLTMYRRTAWRCGVRLPVFLPRAERFT